MDAITNDLIKLMSEICVTSFEDKAIGHYSVACGCLLLTSLCSFFNLCQINSDSVLGWHACKMKTKVIAFYITIYETIPHSQMV